jgi:hypothetical protein
MAGALRRLAGVLGFVAACAAVLLVVEGLARLLGGPPAPAGEPAQPVAERRHTRYDAELGWSHVPGAHVADLYGPGRDLTINGQGLRARREYAARPPAGRTRALCVGDSFTLGYGVGDEDTWCARLERLEPRLETLNMGQGGYGVDQAYLWLVRDGFAFQPDLVLFAFIQEDFVRMRDPEFLGYGKPVLRLAADGGLEVRNVPVPRSGSGGPWRARLARSLDRLRVVQLVRPLLGAPAPAPGRLGREELIRLGGRVFEELERRSRDRGAELVLVYLPMRWDYRTPKRRWREPLAEEARRLGTPFFDLAEELNGLSPSQVDGLYIPDGSLDFPGADGHFNEAGNAWAAQALLQRLRRLPHVWKRIAPSAAGASSP